MSKITQIYDSLVARVSLVLPTYRRLTNPYEVEDNNELYMTKGFGVAVGPGVRTDRIISCQKSWERGFNIILVNQITTTDHNISANEIIQKNILEDHFALFSDLEKETTLSAITIRSQVESDDGLEFVNLETSRYYVMQINVLTEYLEDLS
jgi:hypothetical protein